MNSHYEDKEKINVLPIMLILFIIPLIVHMKTIPLSDEVYKVWTGQLENYDVFSYYKSIGINILAIFSLTMLLVKYWKDNFKKVTKSLYFIPMITYSAMVILSALLSEYKSVARTGFIDRYEGMYVLIAYMIILFVVISIVKKESQVKLLLGALFASAIIIGLLGIFQYAGLDFWKSNFGQGLIYPKEYIKYAKDISLGTGKNSIYSTLYHYNYVGSYMAMLLPLSFTLFLLSKKTTFKVLMGIITMIMAVNCFASTSRAGMIGAVFSIMLLVIVLYKYIRNYSKKIVIGVIGLLAVMITLNIATKGYFNDRFNSIFTDIRQITQKQDINKEQSEAIPLKDIKVSKSKISIVTTTETLNLEVGNGQLFLKDENNKVIMPKYNSETKEIKLLDDRYKDYSIVMTVIKDNNCMIVSKNPIKLFFEIGKDDISLIDNKDIKVEIKPVESFGFKGLERIGSSRGYIWSRSIPLLKKTVVLGNGPDTFALYFPRHDFKGKMYAYYGDMWQVVDKPHSLYLQTALNTGVISLIALISLFIMYIIQSFKIYRRVEYNKFLPIAGLAIFTAVFGYLIAGFFNDSVVSVAPVFWILLGTGISINNILKPKKETTTAIK